jgi:hypothetical protein
MTAPARPSLLFLCGLVPGLGEPCDITDAGVSAAEGDWEGAALSLLSAVPVAGYAGASGKAAKLVDKYNDLRKAKGCSSFIPGTHVLMADGTTKPIEEVEIGDSVIATDPETGQTAAKLVIATIIGAGTKKLAEVIVDVDGNQGDRAERVLATENHPFWDPESETWTTAGQLNAGDQLLTATGVRVEVSNVRPWTTNNPVHNLTIADIHTYYVLAGDTPVLVHNDGGAPPLGPSGDKIFYRNYSYRLDPVPGGSGQFEIHVYHRGVEVGFYGSDGWFDKHGLKGSSSINSADLSEVERSLKGISVDYMRRSGLLRPGDSVKGDDWMRPRC